MTKKHIPEERLVDYILGNTSTKDKRSIDHHLKHCRECALTFKYWQDTLQEETLEKPSTILRERIWQSIQKKKRDKFYKKRPLVYAGASMLAITAIIMSLIAYKGSIDQLSFFGADDASTYQVVHNKEINESDIRLTNDTKRLDVIPYTTDFPNVTGNMWVNDKNKEVLLRVEGLKNYSEYDYQLWFIYDDNDMHAEILPIDNGSTTIYVKGMEVENFKIVKASLEPLGGSNKPTGPDLFIIPVKSNR